MACSAPSRDDHPVTGATVTGGTVTGGTVTGTAMWRRPGLALLAMLAYLPALTAKPGRMPTDTKLYLYLDPGRLIADAPFTWDTRQFAGWVPHQTIAYLWPSGPWFWVFERFGVPDWVAHRLWIGTILFLGGAGVRWAARHLGLTPAGATVAGVVYATSPYVLPYVSRTSVMLLPWAGVGWLAGLTVRAATRRGWRDPALFALVVLTIGAVNATALAFIAPAPVLWLLHAAWQRSITWRNAVMTALRIGTLSLVVSLWWIVMLVVQGRHGADVLAFSETLDAVSLTSVSTEALRGLGYWLFYVRDPYAFTTTASLHYMGSVKVIVIGIAVLVVCLAGIAFTRWVHRRFAALLVFTGVVLAVGVHPIAESSPLMVPLRESPLGLALRSSTRAIPLSSFGMALGAGALVAALGTSRIRWRQVAAPLVALLAIANLPALWNEGLVDAALVRDQDVPAAWSEATARLDAGSSEYRVLQLPGSEFGAFRWGYTVDPPLPGLTDKPLVTRDLLPLGSPGAMDLLYAFDNRFQTGAIDPDSIAAVSRFLAVDTIWLANDLAFDRFRTPRPELIAELFTAEPEGLSAPAAIGAPVVNEPDIAMIDEQALSEPLIDTPLAPVALVDVADAVPVVRAANTVVVLAGSGDGIIDAAAAGVLRGDEAVVYAADLAGPTTVTTAAVPAGSLLIVTDSNRDRAMHWRGSQDVTGLTETGGSRPDALRDNSADQRLAVFDPAGPGATAEQQTTAVLADGLVVRATSYGEPFSYRPEDRPAMAVDGDPATAWTVADRANPIGEAISVSSTDGTLTLLQPQDRAATRSITEIELRVGTAAPRLVQLGAASHVAPGQQIDVAADTEVLITITAVTDTRTGTGTDTGPTGVGFAEIGPVAAETVVLPPAGFIGLDTARPLAIVMTRDRVRPTDRWRSDPEPALVREFTLPVERSAVLTATLRLDRRSADDVLGRLDGATNPPVSNRRLVGVPGAGAGAAFDGDPATSYTTPFAMAVGSSVSVPLDPTTPIGIVSFTQPHDGLHSLVTAVTVTIDGTEQTIGLSPGDDTGISTIDLAGATGTQMTVTITAVEPAFTIDRRFAEPVELPAAITEITGVPLAAAGTVEIESCRQDLITIDGSPVGIRFGTSTAAALRRGDTVDVAACDDAPIELAPGPHRVVSTVGSITGVSVDQVVLRSGDTPPAAASPAATPPAVTVRRTRTTRTADVAACPDGCWLILGEGYNAAWTAAVTGGRPLGAPTQIAGGFNGWWLEPSDAAREVTMRWTPQRGLNIALGIAGLGIAACIAIAAFSRRRLDPSPAAHTMLTPGPAAGLAAPSLAVDPPQTALRPTLVAAGAVVLGAGLAISAPSALLALVPAVLIVMLRRPRLLAWCSPVLAGALGLVVAQRQRSFRYPADAAWTAYFEDLHRPGLFVVVLLVAGCLANDERSDHFDKSGQPGQAIAADTTEPAR